MKKVILTMLAVSAFCVNANALSAQRSREEARFLTDKMAYELYLTEDQIDDVYEINYDYFRALGPIDSAYDIYFNRRYEDLSYVLYDWQWDYFLAREYFLRPAYIYRGGWAFGIYNYYAHTHFFYGLPRIYHHYVGGHYHIHNYYHDRFHMHRHAVRALPRGEHRGPSMRPGIHDNRSRGGNNMHRGIDNRNMNRGNMDVRRGTRDMNPKDMHRDNSRQGSVNREQHRSMDTSRGSASQGSRSSSRPSRSISSGNNRSSMSSSHSSASHGSASRSMGGSSSRGNGGSRGDRGGRR